MHELYFILNDTILPYTMLLPPIETVTHVRYSDVGFMQHLRSGSLWKN